MLRLGPGSVSGVHQQALDVSGEPQSGSRPASPGWIVLLALPILSGASALILEVLWMKELGVLFGNTAHAAGTTLFVFFLGLALGGIFWGRRCARTLRPLRLYGLLELGVGVSGLGYFGLVALYRQSYEAIFDGVDPSAALGARIILSSSILLLPAFLMGGTLPALAERVARTPESLPRLGSHLYAMNTTGAAVGAFLAGFLLPQQLGFRGAYLVAITVLSLVGVAAILVDHIAPDVRQRPPEHPAARVRVLQQVPARRARFVMAMALFSGVLSLGLQVLWTRLLAQVLNNSTYAFSAILVTYLLAMAAGASLVAAATRRGLNPMGLLGWVLGCAGFAVMLSSLALVYVTDGLSVLSVGPDWTGYIVSIFAACGVLLVVPVLVMGMVLPALFGGVSDDVRAPGDTMGRLLAINAIGSMAGALLSAFVLLELLGYWGSLRLLATAYLILGAATLAGSARPFRLAPLMASTLFIILSITSLPGARPIVKLGAGERLIDVIEGSGGTVTVTRAADNLVMRLNNSYVLGDSRSADVERLQAQLPLLLHPAPARVFFLGMGTGVTAAAALDHPVSRVVVTELLPEVVRAARVHFGAVAGGLFVDPRVHIVRDDGRSYLAGKRERFDVIIADLFTPWHAGTASLYTLEHFRTVRDRMRAGGLFVQWLPLHQMSREEFLIIARTMQDVFPQVTVWRGNFSATMPIVALVARADDVALDHQVVRSNVARFGGRAVEFAPGQDVMAGLFYVGNLAGLRGETAALPLNTDDHPVIEYLAPRIRAEGGRGFVGGELQRFSERLLAATPPERDPLLSRFPSYELRYVRSGLEYYRYHVQLARNQPDSARVTLARLESEVRPRDRRSDRPEPPSERCQRGSGDVPALAGLSAGARSLPTACQGEALRGAPPR